MERCSFCGHAADEVGLLVRGPGCAICDACVGSCAGLVARRRDAAGVEGLARPAGGEDGHAVIGAALLVVAGLRLRVPGVLALALVLLAEAVDAMGAALQGPAARCGGR